MMNFAVNYIVNVSVFNIRETIFHDYEIMNSHFV